MTQLDDVQRKLEAAGLVIVKAERLPTGAGDQLRCKTGEIVNVFDTGSVLVQGKNRDRTYDLLGLGGASPKSGGNTTTAVSRKVFVVYGHDSAAKTQLEAMLRRWDLDPLILDQLPSEGQTLIEKLEKYAGSENVSFAVILATPDDEGYPCGREDEKKFRARQNVVMELGLLLGKLGRPRVAILLKNQETMERPSDIQGLIYLPFTDNVEDTKLVLAKEMTKQGLKIDLSRV